MQPLLTIQIPYTIDRLDDYIMLTNELKKQASKFGDIIEFQEDSTDKTMTIGEKRDTLYKRSNGIYTVQWDSDDFISPNGLALILTALKKQPDCVTYQEYVNIDSREYKSRHSLDYEIWEGDGKKKLPDGFHFHRCPFMKNVIRTEVAKKVPVPFIRFAEDHQWSIALRPHLKTEVHVPSDIYRYIHKSSNPKERYGIK